MQNPMSGYDPDALNEQASDADVQGSIEGEIVDITQDVAHNIFGEETQSAPDKEMLVVEVAADGLENNVESVFSLPESDQAWLNPLFKLARYRSKYGSVPEVGQTVQLSPDDNGFMDIDIPDRAETSDD